jgi:hypothetical protein
VCIDETTFDIRRNACRKTAQDLLDIFLKSLKDSIGTLVVDICVVALWKDLSQEVTREIDDQPSLDSLYS